MVVNDPYTMFSHKHSSNISMVRSLPNFYRLIAGYWMGGGDHEVPRPVPGVHEIHS